MALKQEATAGRLVVEALPGATFGGLARLTGAGDARATVAAAEADPGTLLDSFYRSQGLLVLPGLQAISEEPELLVRLSRLFGPEVENYHETLTAPHNVHADVPEIYLVSNIAPATTHPPARPDPPLTGDGRLPTRFPHRRGWHTDQSFRRPPPDISLFYAAIPSPEGQGQTLFADGVAAYAALPAALKARLEGLEGLHVIPGSGRSEYAVRAGEAPKALLPHQRPQRQPVVRRHPVTERRALYLCEAGQMDWIEGPIVGMTPGPDGDGAALLYELWIHYTRSDFTYVHDWSRGDLVIYDNRGLAHAATWFDSEAHRRLMWRTTVRGNPGDEYAGEARSWIPSPGAS